MRDSNPRHPRCKRGDDAPESVTTQGVMPTASAVCTRVCTSNSENGNAGTADAGHQGLGEGATAKPGAASLETLAAALLTLSPADRERLAAMLKEDNA